VFNLIKRHECTKNHFLASVQQIVDEFPKNAICKRIDEKTLTRRHYSALLHTIFHQTYNNPSTFGLAAAQLQSDREELRSYFLHHAEEEKNHWNWIIDDLRNLDDANPDPRDFYPQKSCQAYIAYNYYIATRKPVGRLAIALVLESFGGTYGREYGLRLCDVLDLQQNQCTFFFGHSETDVGHVEDILHILDQSRIGDEEWSELTHIARCAGKMYLDLYESAGSMVY